MTRHGRNTKKKTTPQVDWSGVAQRLRDVRGAATQVEFGRALGIVQNEVSRYETGRVRPPLDYLVAVTKYRKVSLDWLVLGRT